MAEGDGILGPTKNSIKKKHNNGSPLDPRWEGLRGEEVLLIPSTSHASHACSHLSPMASYGLNAHTARNLKTKVHGRRF